MPPRIVSGPRASIATTRNVLRAMRASSADCARGVTSSFTIDGASTSSLHGRARSTQTGAAPPGRARVYRERMPSRETFTARAPKSSRESVRTAPCAASAGSIAGRPAPTRCVGTSRPVSNFPSPRSVTRRMPLVESGPPSEKTL